MSPAFEPRRLKYSSRAMMVKVPGMPAVASERESPAAVDVVAQARLGKMVRSKGDPATGPSFDLLPPSAIWYLPERVTR